MHDGLQFVLLAAGDADGIALYLSLSFRKFVADEFGDPLGFILIEAAHERHFLGCFEIGFDDVT